MELPPAQPCYMPATKGQEDTTTVGTWGHSYGLRLFKGQCVTGGLYDQEEKEV